MDPQLVAAVEKLHISSSDEAVRDEIEDIDVLLEQLQPRKRQRRTPEGIKKELEEQYLKPSTSFGTAWLNKLQQYVRF